MRIRIEPPSVNHSEAGFLPSDGSIRYSLAALRNVGKQAVDHICAERTKRGPFKDISAFARAINPRLVNKRALETLASAGAFDELGLDRATALANVDRIMAAGSRSLDDESGGQVDLFAGAARTPPPIELRKRAQLVNRRLTHAYPDARCSLDYRTPLELLIATILSAQCTDERVNMVTPELFRRFPNAEAYAKRLVRQLERLGHKVSLEPLAISA